MNNEPVNNSNRSRSLQSNINMFEGARKSLGKATFGYKRAKEQFMGKIWDMAVWVDNSKNILPEELRDTNLDQNFKVLPFYPVETENGLKIIKGETIIFRQQDLETGKISQLLFRHKTDDGKIKVTRFLKEESVDPIIFGNESELVAHRENKITMIPELSLGCSISDGVKIHDYTLAPALVYEEYEDLLEGIIPFTYRLNILVKGSIKDKSNEDIENEIRSQFADQCVFLEIGFYEEDLSQIMWTQPFQEYVELEGVPSEIYL